MGGHWIADTPVDERFRLYTRGNTGEVFPNVITPLTATLIGDQVRQAQTQLILDMGVLRPHEVSSPTVSTGVFGGYLYMNISAMRLFGVRMPGMTAAMAEEMVTGGNVGLPPYVRQKGDRNVRATLSLLKVGFRILNRPDLESLDEARRDAQRWAATMPDLADATDAQLLAWLDSYPVRLGASMHRLLAASSIGSAPRGILEQLVERRRGASRGLMNRIVAGAGDVDSAQPAIRLWALSRIVRADASLTAAFDAGLDHLAARLHGSALAEPLQAFLRDHGHRGNDEYELATPAWAMDPRPVHAAIERLRHADDDRDPAVAAARLRRDAEVAIAEAVGVVPRPVRWLVRRAATVARLGGVARERAKDILVLENLAARRVLHELLRRAAERGGPDVRAGFSITYDELPRYLEDPGAFADTIAERAEREAYLNDRLPPFWFDGEIAEPSTWPRRADAAAPSPIAGQVLEGIAVSGGAASGRARVITDPGDPRGLEPGEVLVCAITDPSWTPLFLTAAAVACDAGATLSHAAIVARELGIPAVMSVPGITSIADGTMLHVDGDAGTVTIA